MSKLAAPVIIAAHVAHLPELDGWDDVAVYDGPRPDRSDVRRWATIGHLSGDDGPSVHLEPVHLAQSQNREAGSIACGLYVAADDQAAARVALFGLLLPWSSWLAADPTLTGGDGQAQLLQGSALTLTVDVTNTRTRAGATATAVVSITYTAVTYG